jgi:hypothetical protein
MSISSGYRNERDPSALSLPPREKVQAADRPIFDRSRSGVAPDPRKGFSFGAHSTFHRTAADRRPPSSNTTAVILGDPRPGRSALDRTP